MGHSTCLTTKKRRNREKTFLAYIHLGTWIKKRGGESVWKLKQRCKKRISKCKGKRNKRTDRLYNGNSENLRNA